MHSNHRQGDVLREVEAIVEVIAPPVEALECQVVSARVVANIDRVDDPASRGVGGRRDLLAEVTQREPVQG